MLVNCQKLYKVSPNPSKVFFLGQQCLDSIQTSSCKYFHSDKGIFHYIDILLSYKTMMHALVGLVCGCSIYRGSTAWSWNSKLLQLLHQKATFLPIGAAHSSPLVLFPVHSSECQLWQQASSCCINFPGWCCLPSCLKMSLMKD